MPKAGARFDRTKASERCECRGSFLDRCPSPEDWREFFDWPLSRAAPTCGWPACRRGDNRNDARNDAPAPEEWR